MARPERIQLISALRDARQSDVVVYFTGGKSQIAEDAVPLLYRHLLKILGSRGDRKKIELFLYSRGGDVSVPWRVVSVIREFCDQFNVLIPYRCHSAATMICLGADAIVMGKKAELSPIDPTLNRVTGGSAAPAAISVEDVSSYVSFMRDIAGITDQAAIAQVIGQLANHIGPLALGSVNRQYSHIRLVARKLLTSRNQKIEEGKVAAIIETLTEKMYSHGHAIARREAEELGLPIERPNEEQEELMWKLYEQYEAWLKPHETVDSEEVLVNANADQHMQPGVPLAVVETEHRLDVFEINLVHRRKRQVPQNPQINVNLNLALPPNLGAGALPPNVQQLLQNMINQVAQAVPAIVHAELVRQSPAVGFELGSYGGNG